MDLNKKHGIKGKENLPSINNQTKRTGHLNQGHVSNAQLFFLLFF